MLKQELLQEMRELYKVGDIEGLKKKRLLSDWLLSKEEKEKIDSSIERLVEESESIKACRKYLQVERIIYY